MITASWLPPARFLFRLHDDACQLDLDFDLTAPWISPDVNDFHRRVGSTRTIAISGVRNRSLRVGRWRARLKKGKYSKNDEGARKGDRRPFWRQGETRRKQPREYIVEQSRRRRTTGNEDRDYAEEDVAGAEDDSPFNSEPGLGWRHAAQLNSCVKWITRSDSRGLTHRDADGRLR